MSVPTPHVVPLFATPLGVVAIPGGVELNPSLESLLEIAEEQGSHVGPHDLRWMPIEGCHHRAEASRSGLIDHAPERALMAEVHAVVHANRHDRAVRLAQGAVWLEDSHQRGNLDAAGPVSDRLIVPP